MSSPAKQNISVLEAPESREDNARIPNSPSTEVDASSLGGEGLNLFCVGPTKGYFWLSGNWISYVKLAMAGNRLTLAFAKL